MVHRLKKVDGCRGPFNLNLTSSRPSRPSDWKSRARHLARLPPPVQYHHLLPIPSSGHVVRALVARPLSCAGRSLPCPTVHLQATLDAGRRPSLNNPTQRAQDVRQLCKGVLLLVGVDHQLGVRRSVRFSVRYLGQVVSSALPVADWSCFIIFALVQTHAMLHLT